MTYDQIEDALVALLETKGVTVEALPHVGKLNDAITSPQIFVIVNGSTFGEPETMDGTAQLDTVECEVFIKSKRRRGDNGIFGLYGDIKKRLLGRKLPGAKTPITFRQFGYVAGNQNAWQYALTFSFDTYIVESEDATTEQPGVIKKITFNADEE